VPIWPHGENGHPPLLTFGPNANFADLVVSAASGNTVEKPYGGEIAAGKNTYVYDAHTYHTKVPPQGIQLLVEHYTNPGDVVLDPFCGSGMTGVAARESGRKVLLSDLSPAAAFIAYNHNTPIDPLAYLAAVTDITEQARDLERQLYSTDCRECGRQVPLLYMVWSYGVLCSGCGEEVVLWDVARDERPSVRESKILKCFDCPHCGRHVAKRGLVRTRRYPVQVGYRCCTTGLKERTAQLTQADYARLDWISSHGVDPCLWYPRDEFPDGVNTRQAILAGITSVDRAYTPRALWMMAHLWDAAARWPNSETRLKLFFTLTSLYQRVTLFSEFRFWGGSGNTANYNVPFIINEQNVLKTFERKARTIAWYFANTDTKRRDVRVGVQSACSLPQIPDHSIDYVFTDPPFGANINYSEMNYLWESWLGCHTDATEEAIVNRVQKKGIGEYGELLRRAFTEIRRVLKSGGWFTIVFHNSSADVWQALQSAISDAGFVVEGTQTFDKQHGTFKQFVSDNAVGYDLVLHCRSAAQVLSRLVPHAHVEDCIDRAREAMTFIRGALRDGEEAYRVRYLHVGRRAEFDYRRLYAEWLQNAVGRQQIAFSFDEFRALVDVERESLV